MPLRKPRLDLRGRASARRGTAAGSWPGLDPDFAEVVADLARSSGVHRFRASLERRLARARGKISPFGLPVRVRWEQAATLAPFVVAYHRAIEAIVAASGEPRVREALALPDDLEEVLGRDRAGGGGRVHLCRLDLLLDSDGGFRVLETNANCPGALISCGIAGRHWREHLAARDIELPPALAHEGPTWMADWFLDAARVGSRFPIELVALFRERGGNRLELPELHAQLRQRGVEAVEVDPRRVRAEGDGPPLLEGRRFHHGYLKLRIQSLRRMRNEMASFLATVGDGRLFVQNGLRGRLVGDNKLCLAILSDPAFDDLFDAADLATLRPHLPWSRSLAGLPAGELSHVRKRREAYVLKSPLDTQGRGIVIGREVSRSRWARQLERALRDRWLVQEFCTTTSLVEDDETRFHDLSLGVVEGRLAGAVVRSSLELRTNVARTGRLHPVFMDPTAVA